MGSIIILLIKEWLDGLLDYMGELLFKLSDTGLYPEEALAKIGFSGVQELFKIFLYTGTSLLVLKFLKKGFEIYILGVDGDPDVEPVNFVINFFKAMAISLTFPELYGYLAEIVSALIERSVQAIGVGEISIGFDFMEGMLEKGFFVGIAIFVFMVFYIIFYIKFLKIGLQVLILRAGLPLACSGIMDADQGVFRSFTQKFLQVGITILLQIILAQLSLALVLSEHLLWAFAALSFAASTPRFLQEFLIVPQGGGGGNKIYQAQAGIRLFQTVKSFVS